MPHVEAGDQRLYYEETGDGEPLLLVIGLGADHLAWAMQLPAWSERYRTIVFDNRDAGQSSCVSGPYTIRDMAADTLALADALALESFHLLGISMGGAIAQEVALAEAHRVRTLTLGMTWAGDGRWGVERARLMANDALRTPPQEQAEKTLLMCLSEEAFESPDAVARLREMLLEGPNPQSMEAFCRQVQAMATHETRDRLGRISAPTHVIVAEHDIMVPPWKGREVAELVPGAKLTVIERGTHAVNMEQADRFNAVVLGFLAEAARARPEPERPAA